MALGYGGLVQLIAGVEEWACGNVRHTSIPLFGIELGTDDVDLRCDCIRLVWRILVLLCCTLHPRIRHRQYVPPSSPSYPRTQADLVGSYEDEGQFASAVGIYLVSWALVTLIFLIAALRSSVALVSLFFMLDLTFWLLAGSEFSGSVGAHKAGGITGIVSRIMVRDGERGL